MDIIISRIIEKKEALRNSFSNSGFPTVLISHLLERLFFIQFREFLASCPIAIYLENTFVTITSLEIGRV